MSDVCLRQTGKFHDKVMFRNFKFAAFDQSL